MESKDKTEFSMEEVVAAKQVRDEIIEQAIPELKSIYIAGEIVMWDEINSNYVSKDKVIEIVEKAYWQGWESCENYTNNKVFVSKKMLKEILKKEYGL